MTKGNHSLKQKPVIFLAFANDRAQYLRNLRIERRGIQKVLDEAIRAGLCKVEVRTDAAIEDILDVFQDREFRDRIAIFHYSGHAEDYALILETFEGKRSPAYKEGLVSFLAGQNGLKLIFLNGCSTKEIALDLREAGIPAVIGTSQAIDDEVAMKLAIRFYHGIANGSALERAWQEAEKGIKIQKGTSGFKAYYSVHKTGHEDCFPWDIFFQEDAEKIKEWNLPDAVDDPLFGLPKIPNTYGLPEVPFLYLRRYEREHARIFFGRSYDIRYLYKQVIDKNSPPIILLHGQSGVGKSSLLDAGLIPRLENSYVVLYAGRIQEKGLLGTLEETLEHHLLKLSEADRVESTSIQAKWKHIEAKASKSLVIILDQAEEIFTRPNGELPNEFNDFLEALLLIFAEPLYWPKGKLILGYRKEYHPEIEKGFANYKLPKESKLLEPLGRKDIIEVVMGLTKTYDLKQHYRNLDIEEGLPGIIADDLSKDKNSSIAPVLQIILTKMWDMTKTEHPHPKFTVKKYRQLEDKGNAMEDFFKQQMEKLKEWNTDVVDSGLALGVLKFHTTELGTSCSRDIKGIKQVYAHSQDIIDGLVIKLKGLYLLTDSREGKNETSLAHDTLAPIVIKEYNDSYKPGQRASRILAARIEDFKKSPGEVWLNKADLKMVVKGRSGMRALDNDERKLLEKSRKRKTRRELIRVASIFLIVVFALVAAWQWKEASNKRIFKANSIALQAQSDAAKSPTAALCLAEHARQLHENNITTAAVYNIYRENSFYKIIARLNKTIKSAAFSRDGRYIGVRFDDDTSRLWDLNGIELKDLKKHRVAISFDDSSAYGQHTLVSSEEGIIRLVDVKRNISQDFLGHEGRVSSHVFSPDGRYVLTGSEDKTARLWDLRGKTLQVFRGHEGSVTSVAFSPDGRNVLTGSSDNTLLLWELKDIELRVFGWHGNRVYSAVFSPDGKHILTGSKDGTLNLWNLKTGQAKIFASHKRSVTSAAFSPDGKHILTGFEDGTVQLCDPEGNETQAFKAHKSAVVSLAFSPDGQKVLTASYDRTAGLWGLEGNELQVFNGHKHRVTSVAFSPEGRYILTGSYDRTARLWDLEGNELKVFPRHKHWVTAVAFWPDGKSILTGSWNTIVRWDLKGNELQVFKGHEKSVRSIIFSPDGEYILTGSFDKTARLWDLKGNQLQVFKGHEGIVHSAAFSPDGKNVVTGSFDGTARLWKINKVEDFLRTGVCEKLGDKQ